MLVTNRFVVLVIAVILPLAILGISNNNGGNGNTRRAAAVAGTQICNKTVYVNEQNHGNEHEAWCNKGGVYRTLDMALNCTSHCETPIVVKIIGNVTLNTTIQLINRQDIHITGEGQEISSITCGWKFKVFNKSSIGAGILFHYTKNIKISNLTMNSCGALETAENGEIDDTFLFRSAIHAKNCTNISITDVTIDSSNGLGLAVTSAIGVVNIINCIFTKNHIWSNFTQYTNTSVIHGGGAIHILMQNVNNTVFNIEDTICDNNTKQTTPNYPHASSEEGGAILIYLADNTEAIMINMQRCNLTGNTAKWGGAVFIGIVKNSSRNKITLSDSTIKGNKVLPLTFGGGGIDVGLFYFDHKDPPSNNTIEVIHTFIQENEASYGGGTTIFSEADYRYNYLHNNITFVNCTWSGNKAFFGSAVDIAPNIFQEEPGTVCLKPTFTNCTFISNSILSPPFEDKEKKKVFDSAAVSITAMNIVFAGQTVFENNLGTALTVNFAKATFEKKSIVKFTNNTGNKGGAIGLFGISFIEFGNHLQFHIQNNTAELGGGIYAESNNQHDYLLTRSCFIKPKTWSNTIHDKTTTFTFQNNIAKSNIGHSIFVSTLKPCNYSCFSKSYAACEKEHPFPKSVFHCCIANFTFDNRKNNINTMAYKITMKSTKKTAFPGEQITLQTKVYDETNTSIDKISVFKVSTPECSDVHIEKDTQYTVTGKIRVTGNESTNGSVILQTTDFIALQVQKNIVLTRCPPGYINSNTQECICDSEKFFGIQCSKRIQNKVYMSYIMSQVWAGLSDSGELLTTLCPIGYCKPIENNGGFKNLSLEDVENNSICVDTRTGILCSRCINGTSVAYHSRNYECIPNENCGTAGMFIYISTELFPITIMFIVAIFFNISFTSGALSGFIFYAQVVQIYDTNDYAYPKKLRHLLEIERTFYGIFNLKLVNWKKYCLWKGSTTLDTLAIKYVTITYCFMLVVSLLLLLNRCTHHRLARICCLRERTFNLLHGLAAFLVVCYSQCARVTLELLRPATIWGRGQQKYKGSVVFLKGDMPFFGIDHLKYALPALFFLTILIILPPLILLFNSVMSVVLSFLSKRGHCRSNTLVNQLLMVQLKPLFDTFQGTFKDNCRSFAGMLFVYRVLLMSLSIFLPTKITFYLYSLVSLTLILAAHAIIQPYRIKWHNVLDILYLTNLIFLNGTSIYLYINSNIFSWDDLRGTLAVKTLPAVQLILLYMPIGYVTVYAGCNIYRILKESCCKKKLSIRSQDSSEGDNDEWPDRILVGKEPKKNYESFEHSQSFTLQ